MPAISENAEIHQIPRTQSCSGTMKALLQAGLLTFCNCILSFAVRPVRSSTAILASKGHLLFVNTLTIVGSSVICPGSANSADTFLDSWKVIVNHAARLPLTLQYSFSTMPFYQGCTCDVQCSTAQTMSSTSIVMPCSPHRIFTDKLRVVTE